MNYGLYLSASGVLTNMYRQDVFANNLANANTVAFKRDVPAIRPRSPQAVETPLGFDVSQRLLDRLGGGVFAGPQQISFAAAPFRKTGNPLDAALEDPQAFFVVAQDDSAQPALTRDGRMTPNADGFLVTAVGGHLLLDTAGQPIAVNPSEPIELDAAGRVRQGQRVVGQLQITGVRDLTRLQKFGENLLIFKDGRDGRRPADQPTIKVGFVEASGVDPIKALLRLVEATKAVTANGNLIRYHDQMMDRAVNVLGRVA